MKRFIIVGISSGLLFGLLDGLINANPFAVDLYRTFSPIARSSVNIPAGILIDLTYGFILAGLFLVLYKSLPGTTGLTKGVAFGLMLWFLRVLMSVASQWMTYTIPAATLLYMLGAGLFEMVILGIFYGTTLKPEDLPSPAAG